MIKFRQKEYSSLGTKLSYGIENAKEAIREKKVKRLEKISTNKSDDVRGRAANIELIREKKKSPRTKYQIKKDSIITRENIKSTVKDPKLLAKKTGKAVDNAIQVAIKRPQIALGAASQVIVPAAGSLISPAVGAVSAALPVGTAINIAPLPNKVNKKLNSLARKYRGTEFSKKLGGRV